MARINYINNPKFQEEMLKYHEQLKISTEKGEPEPKANDYIGKCIYHIATRYANKSKFYGYTNLWKEEMISDGIENSIKYGLKNYDPTKYSNPFAYFTEIIHWSFVRRIKREKREQYKKLKSQVSNELLSNMPSTSVKKNSLENETADMLIREFEAKMVEEKTKRNVKKGIELFVDAE